MHIYRSVTGVMRGGLNVSWPRLPSVLLLLVTASPAFTGYSVGSAELAADGYYPSLPSFDSRQPTELQAILGQSVLLPCTVHNLADKLVSWVRVRDLNILTHGTASYTADPRFDIQHQLGSDTWALKIRAARLNDTGRYECQVNTDPKMSLFFNLNVQEHASPVLRAAVSGPRQQYVSPGSTVTFVCEVTLEGRPLDGPVPKAFRPNRGASSVHWLHNGLAVSFQAERGGISIDTASSDQGISSRLTVAGVRAADAGRYACGAGGAADSVELHVRPRPGGAEDEGEHMEAMQRDQASSEADGCRHYEAARTLYVVLVAVVMTMNLPAP